MAAMPAVSFEAPSEIGRCVILVNGAIDDYPFHRALIRPSDCLICADGGARHARRMDRTPQVVIGDLDSLLAEDRAWLDARQVPIIRHPERKNATDTELALDLALSLRPAALLLLGAAGKRHDHFLANVTLLKRALEKNVPASIQDENNEILLIDRPINLAGQPGDLLSLIPFGGQVTGVTLDGLEYPLDNAPLELGTTLGISNRFASASAVIQIKTGLLLVIRSRDPQ